ncbi:MerR family transcriptional regulator [Orbaceae bacterium ac157xtp]
MKIGELAKLAQCTTETIRFYEKIDLLPKPDRTENNYRIYSKKHLDRLIFIRNCRALEMSHDEIRSLIQIMDNQNQSDNHKNAHLLLNKHLHHIDARIKELTRLRAQLTKLEKNCRPTDGVCGILQEISGMEVEAKSKVDKSHL